MNGLSLAFVAGVVAALNPCGFAMLPGYLVLALGDSATAVGEVLAEQAITDSCE